MSTPATAPTDPPVDRQTITHQIGDITVTIDLPADCPAPRVDLNFQDYERANVAAAALGLGTRTIRSHQGSRWYAGESADGQMDAAVFLR